MNPSQDLVFVILLSMTVAFTEIVLFQNCVIKTMDKIWEKAMNFSSRKPVIWLESPSGVSKNLCLEKVGLWVVSCQPTQELAH